MHEAQSNCITFRIQPDEGVGVERRSNWGDDWLARPKHGIARYFPNKVEAVKYLLIDEE
jgi:hypothetical protein